MTATSHSVVMPPKWRWTRHLTHVYAIVAAMALVGAGWFAGSAAVDGVKLVRILRGEFRGDGTHPQLGVPVPAHLAVRTEDGRVSRIDLSSGSAILLLYDVRCSVCNDNMARWVDLVVEARRIAPGARVYAIPPTADPAAMRQGYWTGLETAIQVLTPVDPDVAHRLAGTQQTPTTVVVRNGVRVAAHTGYLGDRRRSFIVGMAK